MPKNKSNWIIIILLVLIVILLIPQVFSHKPMSLMHSGYGMKGYDMKGYGMMGSGMFGFGWILPVIFVILVIATGVWLGNVFTGRGKKYRSHQKELCSNCSKHIEGDWQTCPYCSESLE